MTKVSVTLVTYNRGHLLERSLARYAAQNFQDFELVIVDDDSTDDTAQICKRWAQHIDLKYLFVAKRGAGWRDCAMNINLGIRACKGEFIIGSHPEVIPGNNSIRDLYENRQPKVFGNCKVYYLTPWNQDALDSVSWRSEGVLAIRDIPGFYNEGSVEVTGNPDYTHEATDRHTVWGSWVFGGFLKSDWSWLGGMEERPSWGSIDVSLLERRRVLGISTYTPSDQEAIVLHQNHDIKVKDTDILTDRDMNKALGNVPRYHTPEDALLSHLW